MDYIDGIQKAINYIELHLTDEINIENIAKEAMMSICYFQRIFGILCGVTLGEYIRLRKLSLAGVELVNANSKIIDIAFKYGYETPESFTRAFVKFHGISPREAKGNKDKLRYFSRLSVKITLCGGKIMDYRIEERKEMLLTGYKRRFRGVPYGKERHAQEKQFFISTRAMQWMLLGSSYVSYDEGSNTGICVIDNIDAEGYDFYLGMELGQFERENINNPDVMGVDCMEKFGFENIVIPKQTYAVFTTEEQIMPIPSYFELRKSIANEIVANDNLKISDAPELSIYFWFNKEKREKRYIEIWIPIEKNNNYCVKSPNKKMQPL